MSIKTAVEKAAIRGMVVFAILTAFRALLLIADTEYQRGYSAALADVEDMLEKRIVQRDAQRQLFSQVTR